MWRWKTFKFSVEVHRIGWRHRTVSEIIQSFLAFYVHFSFFSRSTVFWQLFQMWEYLFVAAILLLACWRLVANPLCCVCLVFTSHVCRPISARIVMCLCLCTWLGKDTHVSSSNYPGISIFIPLEILIYYFFVFLVSSSWV